ncbi:MAG: hypothetical protein P1U36_01725 [Legionellaceae bacterium]|nr:hypothetical protein [Legionellaceae bacterium]
MPSYISMESTSSGQVDITLNLSFYIEAYEKAYGYQRSPGKSQADAIAKFKQQSLELSGQLTGLTGQMHWLDALRLATEDWEPSQQDAVAQSPAARMMDNSFIEIIKNSMDEVISMHYDSTPRKPPIIQLTLKIDNTSYSNQISIQITDSGRGFPDSFLDKINTPSRRATYVNASRGSNKTTHHDRPPLFGGQGRGLRILIADENGDALERSGQRVHRFIKPEISSVEFINALDAFGHCRGARITVTTSIEPREEYIAEAIPQEKNHITEPSPKFSLSFLSGLNISTEDDQSNDDNLDIKDNASLSG